MRGFRLQASDFSFRESERWPGYVVTEDGHVFSYWRQVQHAPGLFCAGLRSEIGTTAREVASFDRKDRKGRATGYRTVCLSREGAHRNVYVHDLVCRTFHGPPPSKEHQVLHKNGERGDNRAENPRWGTVQENADDRRSHGRVYSGSVWRMNRGLLHDPESPDPVTPEPFSENCFADLLEQQGAA